MKNRRCLGTCQEHRQEAGLQGGELRSVCQFTGGDEPSGQVRGIDTSQSSPHPLPDGGASGCPVCGLHECIITLLAILDFIQQNIQSLFLNSGFRKFYLGLCLHSGIDDGVITKSAILGLLSGSAG